MKTATKILSMLLAVLMIVSIVPVTSIEASAASNIVINGVDIGYSNGSYFTKNGKSCANSYWSNGKCHGHNICVASTHSQCNCMRYWPTGYSSTCQVDLLSTQCMGFARYCQWKVYGYHDGSSSSKFTNICELSASNCTATTLKSKLLNCAPATHIRTGNNKHSQSIISTSDYGVTVAECNVDGYCGVRTKSYSWAEYASYFSARSGVKYAYSYTKNTGSTITPTTCSCSTSYAGYYTCATSSSSLTIRSGHGTSYSAIGSIPKGATVYVSKANGSWAHITYNGVSGYASMSYLTKQTTYYTISYNANGGTGAPSSQTKTHGTALTLSTTKPIRTGYTFLGWSTSSITSIATYSAGGSFTTNANTTLYAVWRANTYTIVYNGNGNTGGSTSASSHKYNSLIAESDIINYTAYEFMQTGHDFSPIIDKYGTGKYFIDFYLYADVAGSMRVYFQNGSTSEYAFMKEFDATTSWKRYTFVVDVELQDSSVSQSMLAFYGGYGTGRNPHVRVMAFTKVDEKLTANGFTKTGYSFLGWSQNPNATSATYADGQEVKNLTKVSNDTINLYAVWKPNTYTVKFNANGGTGTMSNQTYTYGYLQSLSANRFTKQGYSFVGWATSPTSTSAEFSDMMLVQNLTSTNGGTVTLYAVWKANTYTVSYNANGGTGVPSSQTKTHGIALTLSTTKPTRTGYTFLGWSTSPTATSATYSAGGSFTTNANTTLYAVWKKVGHDINNDGIVNSNDTGLYKYNGTWYYVKNGNIDYTFTGLTKHTNGVWYYVENGILDWSYSGLWKHNGTWYYVQKGQINWKFTGLVKHTNGIWYYIQNAKLNWNKTGLVKHTNGIWYYVQKGQLNWNKTGLVKHTDGNWYYVQKGQINWNYTGLVKHTNGKYYFVQKGKLNWNYTGYAYYNGKKYKVVNGVKV